MISENVRKTNKLSKRARRWIGYLIKTPRPTYQLHTSLSGYYRGKLNEPMKSVVILQRAFAFVQTPVDGETELIHG